MTQPKEWAVSPSQISSWRECHRKYAWSYVLGLKKEQNVGAEYGSRVHKGLEQYLKGELPKSGVLHDLIMPVLSPALKHFPTPGTAFAEEKFKFHWDGVLFTGRTDARNTTTVFDLKTTKDRKYAKKAPELSVDPQGILYAKAFPGTSSRWVYTLTEGTEKAWPVDFTAVRDGAPTNEILRDAKEILDVIHEKKHPLKLLPPEDQSVCNKYGKCPFYDLCTDLSPFRGVMRAKDKDMGLLDKMRAEETKTSPRDGDGVVVPINTVYVQDAAINPPEVAGAGAPPPPPTEKPKRAPRKAKQLPLEAAPVQPVQTIEGQTTEVVKPTTASSETVGTETAAPVGPSATVVAGPIPLTVALLFINSKPRGAMAAELFDVQSAITKVKDAMREQGVGDYRYLDFAVGAGNIAYKTMEVLAGTEQAKNGTLMLYVNSQLPEGKLVLGELVARATVVIEGD